uniref:Uncharacterized protein n=1 Tax=Pseudo-nitzschia australis TaxID=44445 RepID=A0A7S4AX07_9STRA|mmetsp:Transcript_7374/g.15788  ORF Transcript_7374/g.15788 Transcript_7374/m.15788 type:complete len:234 (+) Transcript_7374:297-998(+)|eukprot:CAMPEP_0168166978 /NCGR_PEP_ID=MMETSP0139_2-20121125/2312_1 /TAXON_ID=44445 /ORGANISM="Pseudo-nitzschia australis, Strain 10249 10 AB" /LENGTH=233 /DNA_ID=CAMNT_0008084205 /DNA_START=263 /DNA_END=964 /DNA_ORIENTATION=-
MGIWGSVKNAAEKTKMRGDIALAQRGITARKKKFGVEFYNILTNDKQRLLGGSVAAGSLSVFKKNGKEDPLKDAFDAAHEDIRGMEARKEMFQQKLDVMEVKGSHSMPDNTIGQKVSKTGKKFSDAGNGTKHRAQMALVDREMKIRKERFGCQVFDMASTTDDKGKKGLIKGTISKALTSLSDHEKEIQKVVDTAKKDVAEIEGKVQSLQRQIALLDPNSEPSETEPLATNNN